jgi:site-specific DNA-methyltransferase (adenine-specific)
MTPYYEQDGITIYHGDCRERDFEVSTYRVITDPPYDLASLRGYVPFTVTTAVFGYPEVLVRWCVDAGVVPSEWVTWWPTNKVTARNHGLNQETEHVALFGEIPGANRLQRPRSKDGARIQRTVGKRAATHELAKWGDVWRMPSPGCGYNYANRLHPNEKPEELLIALVTLCTDTAADVIFDPFMGSGTTLVAAKRLGRKAIGIEIQERYCEIASKRLAQRALSLEMPA